MTDGIFKNGYKPVRFETVFRLWQLSLSPFAFILFRLQPCAISLSSIGFYSSSAAFHIFFLRKNIIVFKMRSRCLSSGASSGKSGNFPKCNQYINTRSILHLVLSSKIKQVQKRFLRLGRFHLPGYATVSPLFVRA
jgi:hypothetical protein